MVHYLIQVKLYTCQCFNCHWDTKKFNFLFIFRQDLKKKKSAVNSNFQLKYSNGILLILLAFRKGNLVYFLPQFLLLYSHIKKATRSTSLLTAHQHNRLCACYFYIDDCNILSSGLIVRRHSPWPATFLVQWQGCSISPQSGRI